MAYDYPSNFSNGTNSVTGLGSLIQYGAYVVSGVLGYALLVLIFMTALIVNLSVGAKKALLSSSFITFMFSVYFYRLEMISPAFLWGLGIFMVILAVLPDKSAGGQF